MGSFRPIYLLNQEDKEDRIIKPDIPNDFGNIPVFKLFDKINIFKTEISKIKETRKNEKDDFKRRMQTLTISAYIFKIETLELLLV